MDSILPIGIEALLSGAVESSRLELKASWDAKSTGPQMLKTLCAFANDLQNLNGGYIVLGVAEEDGQAVRPVKGLAETEIDRAQKWIRGNCRRIEPVYMPVIDVVSCDQRKLVVLWAPASEARPHQAPDGEGGDKRYWLRLGSETVVAKGELLTRLMQQTARVPFDDRRAVDATTQDLQFALVREFLHDVGSDLQDQQNAERVYELMRLTSPSNGHRLPRNIALLFFSEDPQRWFRGARIEVAQFTDDAGGDMIEEKRFSGPLPHQVRQCLTWLDNLTTHHLEKQSQGAETKGWLSYPSLAFRETLVNAVYHRGYEHSVEPTKVYLYPDRVEIISYPGPVEGIEQQHLRPGASVPPVPARNRRIGELFKELRLAEGRGTGLPRILRAMRDNGSPDPVFDFDAERTYFRATLPAHPDYVALSALRDASYFSAIDDRPSAIRRLQAAHDSQPTSALIASRLLQELAADGDLYGATEIGRGFKGAAPAARAKVLGALAEVLLHAGREREAQDVLAELSRDAKGDEAITAAIARRQKKNPP